MSSHGSASSLGGKLALVALGVLIALGLGEAMARLEGREGYEARVQAFGAVMIEPDERLSLRLVPGASTTVAGIEYTASSLGTRGPEPRQAPPHRTLVIGDSVTMGWGVAESETWPARIEANRSDDSEVINAAVLGWGAPQYALRLEELVPRLSPDLVLIGYYPNDPAGSEAVTRSGPSSALWRLLRDRLGGTPAMSATEYHRALHREGSDTWATLRRALSRVADQAAAGDHRCGVVLLPSLSTQPYPLIPEHRRLVALAREEGLEVFDAAPSIEGRAPADLWVASDDAHPNATAHGLFADAIGAWLDAEELYPPEAPGI